MKKFVVKPVILLALLGSVMLISACKKDKDINEADLIGTWNIGQASVDIKVGPISLLQFLQTALGISDNEAQGLVDDYISEYNQPGGTITFNADYTYQILNGDMEENGTWELDGDKLYLDISDETQGIVTLTFESLTSTSALVVWEEDQDVDMDEDGKDDFTATIIIELNLSR